MEVSEKLAFEIYTIVIFHLSALVILFSYSVYIYLRAKKTPLLFSYMAVVAMITLWIISKILKTLAPTEWLRWLFIVIQYFGIDFLGCSLVVFAFVYTKNRLPSKKYLIGLAVLPAISFLAAATNPIHMKFYSYFDFYKDSFGPLFYITQSIQYIYLLAGIIILMLGFTKQRIYFEKRKFAAFFAYIALIPILTNVYYILFKMNLAEWIFPFPVFDFTPIAGSIALMLFMVPALYFRFFDISPVSYHRLFQIMPQGIVFLNKKGNLYGANLTFQRMFGLHGGNALSLKVFADHVLSGEEKEKEALVAFFSEETGSHDYELTTEHAGIFRISKRIQKKGHFLFYFDDISEISKNRRMLSRQNEELVEANRKLDLMAVKTRELAVAKTKAQMAQNVHDILGHSLTVVIGTMELAADDGKQNAETKLRQVKELLSNSLSDLQNVFYGQESKWGQNSLTKALEHLKNDSIQVEIAVHGNVYELNSAKTEAVFRLCQEAVTNSIRHGKAKTIYLILRYRSQEVELYAIDNGKGCSKIVKNYGLSGIEKRITELSGTVDFGSDADSGFIIHALLPK